MNFNTIVFFFRQFYGTCIGTRTFAIISSGEIGVKTE